MKNEWPRNFTVEAKLLKEITLRDATQQAVAPDVGDGVELVAREEGGGPAECNEPENARPTAISVALNRVEALATIEYQIAQAIIEGGGNRSLQYIINQCLSMGLSDRPEAGSMG